MRIFDSFFKEIQIIEFPSSIRSEGYGFEWLCNLVIIMEDKSKTYELDLSRLTWLEGNLCAIIGAIIDTKRKQGFKISYKQSQNDYVNKTMNSNEFINFINNTKTYKTSYNAIPFKVFETKDDDKLEDYIYQNLLNKQDTLDIREHAKKKIYRSIFEIYQNAIMHSNSKNVYLCGQFYPQKRKTALTIVDFGKTIKANVNEFKQEFISFSGKQAIEWAVEHGNTTKPNKEAGGLGIDLIRKFLRLNKGKIQIRSEKGYWEEKKGVIFAKEYESIFEGTIVNIEFNLNDTNTYYTSDDLKPEDIF